MPLSPTVELAHRVEGLGAFEAHQALAAGLAEAAQVPQQLDVLAEQAPLVVTADGLEVAAPAEHDAGVHSQQPHQGDQESVGHGDTEGPPLEAHASGAGDPASVSDRAVDDVEGLGVDAGIGIDEAEHLTAGGPRAAVACSGDAARGDQGDGAAARRRDLGGRGW